MAKSKIGLVKKQIEDDFYIFKERKNGWPELGKTIENLLLAVEGYGKERFKTHIAQFVKKNGPPKARTVNQIIVVDSLLKLTSFYLKIRELFLNKKQISKNMFDAYELCQKSEIFTV